MLLPSSSTGLTNIYAATSCDFACHEQNPHNDNIYVYDTTGREVYLPTTVYSSNGTNMAVSNAFRPIAIPANVPASGST